MRKAVLIASAVLGIAVIGTALAAYLGWRALATPMTLEEPRVLLEVPAGTPLARVSARLAERGMFEHPHLLTWYARLSGAATRVHAGEYELTSGTTPLELLDELVAGNVYMHQVTIIEGWRFADLVRALREHPAIAATQLDGEAIMTEVGEPDVHPEGQFLPDTYTFPTRRTSSS